MGDGKDQEVDQELHKRRRYNSEGEEVDISSKWGKIEKDLSEKDKQKIIEIGIRIAFRNHQWGGDFYKGVQ